MWYIKLASLVGSSMKKRRQSQKELTIFLIIYFLVVIAFALLMFYQIIHRHSVKEITDVYYGYNGVVLLTESERFHIENINSSQAEKLSSLSPGDIIQIQTSSISGNVVQIVQMITRYTKYIALTFGLLSLF
jgi:uncharacterized membrane protein